MTVPLSLIEQVHGPTDRKLRDHLDELGLYDKDGDSCRDPRVAWALMYPSMQAAGLFAEITGAKDDPFDGVPGTPSSAGGSWGLSGGASSSAAVAGEDQLSAQDAAAGCLGRPVQEPVVRAELSRRAFPEGDDGKTGSRASQTSGVGFLVMLLSIAGLVTAIVPVSGVWLLFMVVGWLCFLMGGLAWVTGEDPS